MKNIIMKLGLCIWGLLFLSPSLQAGVIFETTFDSNPDWNVSGQYSGDCGNWTGGVNHCTTAPTGWTNHYTPSGGYISAIPGGLADHTGGSAKKAYMAVYPNVFYSGGAELSKLLDRDYPDLYVRVWMRASPGWQQANTGEASSSSAVKVFRINHFDRTGTAFQYFSTGYTGPTALINWSANNTYYPGSALHIVAYRCEPRATQYYCDNAGSYVDTIGGMPDRARNTDYNFYTTKNIMPTAPGGYADGQWHRWDHHVKMNTHSGSVWNFDGIWEMWYDGVKIRNDVGVQWNQEGATAYTGWNSVQIGGNADNRGTFTSQWIAYDDVVISDTPIPDNYVIGGGGSADTTPPAEPTGVRVR